jgi:hypothetical protein
MSAKDERAREILRGFKLYPPGSGAGPGGLGGGRSLRRLAGAGGARWAPVKKGRERGLERNSVRAAGGTGNGTGSRHRGAL